MTTENVYHYWKIEDGRIVALTNMTFNRGSIVIPAGSIGAIIPSHVQLPSPEVDVWVSDGVEFVTPERETQKVVIQAGVFIGVRCNIGLKVEIGESSFVDREVTLRDGVILHDMVCIHDGVTIEMYSHIANRVCIDRDSRVGEFVTIKRESYVGHDVVIHNGSTIGKHVHIDDDTVIGPACRIRDLVGLGDGVVLGSNVTINHGASIGRYAHIGSRSQIDSDMTVTSYAQLTIGKYVQLHSIGGNNRNMIIYVDRYGDVVMSVGCQHGISMKTFKYRVRRGCGTHSDSVDIYRNQMGIIEAAFASVGRANNIGTIYKIFKFAKKLFGVVELGQGK